MGSLNKKPIHNTDTDSVLIRAFTDRDAIALSKVLIDAKQEEFTATPCIFINEERVDLDKYIVLLKGVIVGYFKIDRHFNKLDATIDRNSVGLRSLAIDSRWQGKGIGKRTIYQLRKLLRLVYPNVEWLYLTVNVRNVTAHAFYLTVGFEETGSLFHGGPVGPQYIMRCRLS